MDDKNNLYLIGIVGLIAIVGIVVMIIGSANVGVYTPVVATINSAASNDNSISSSDTSGQAFIADTTPRIAYWSGKVNQHVNIATGVWATDPDGTSGATINMLTYCKKWYPRTTGYVAYKMETITTWRNGGNTGGPFTSTKQSYKCLQSVPVCGDGTCNSVESCSSCPGDCGTCPVSTCTGSANQSCSIANGAGTIYYAATYMTS